MEAASRKPDMVIVIVDLGLPRMGGVEVVRAQLGWTTLQIIILSDRITEQHQIEALDAGAHDYHITSGSL